MGGKRYPKEFKIEAVRQVTERVDKVREVAQRLGACMTGSSDMATRVASIRRSVPSKKNCGT